MFCWKPSQALSLAFFFTLILSPFVFFFLFFCVCHCIICIFHHQRYKMNHPASYARFFFCTWAGIIEDGIQSCTVHSMCSKHNQPRYLKHLFFCLFVLLAGELSKATESFRQEMGVHFYASRSTSEVGFFKNHTRIEQLWVSPLTTSLWHD